MQPLDNGSFNAVKAAYQKELKKFNFNTDSQPVDKINFIKAYNKARKAGLTEKNILPVFRTTGN
jgi:ribosomal protein L7/L12